MAPARGGVDQQATRRDEDGTGGTISSGRLKSSPRVRTFLKVTVAAEVDRPCARPNDRDRR